MKKAAVFAVFLALAIALSTSVFAVESQPAARKNAASAEQNSENGVSVSGIIPEYEEYSAESDAGYTSEIIDAVPSGITAADDGFLLNGGQHADFKVNIQKTGLYRIFFEYKAASEEKNDWNMSLEIDGKLPFAEADSLVLDRLWKNKSPIVHKDEGNDVRPEVIQEFIWQSYEACDSKGESAKPFAFRLEAGEHIITLVNEGQDIYFKNFKLDGNENNLPSYEEYKKLYPQKETTRSIILEAEDTLYTNSRSLIAASDLTSPKTSPQSAYSVKLNTLGGANWKYAGDTAYYEFEAPEEGFYRISLRFRQNFYNGINTHRRLYVNGKVPYIEVDSISFPYGVGWQVKTLDYEIYLPKGKNSIALEAVSGENGPILSELSDIIYSLNNLFRMIITVTGQTPDVYRDYNLKDEIPGLEKALENCFAEAETLEEKLQQLYGGGSELSSLTQIKVQLEDMLDDPETITKGSRLTQFKSNISALGAWLNKIREQPLELDVICLLPEKASPPQAEAGFFAKVSHNFKRFLSSFVTDYSVMGGKSGGVSETVRVWVSTGREQAQLLKAMIDDTFTPNHNIGVQVELVPTGGLVEAILADQGPDVALDRAGSDPVNMAMRNALVELSGFDGFSEVTAAFSPVSMQPFKYKDGYYGLPQTQNFDMLFYRTDIFDELGIKVPETWDELMLDVLPVLETANMTAGVGVLTEATVFKTLLYQSGGSIYSEDLQTAALDSQLSYTAFKYAVDFYTDYGLPKSYDFMNRFRTGEMPISVAPYTMYNNLTIGAPELNGLWKMAPIPGVRYEDGSINRTQIMTETAVVMTKSAENRQAAWEFMKWWVSAPAQSRFGNDIEAILGVAGRYTPANKAAMRELPWEAEQLKLLESQRDISITLPNIPGSYFTQRAIYNAFVSTVIDTKNPREQLIYWNEEVNLELARKRQEFN